MNFFSVYVPKLHIVNIASPKLSLQILFLTKKKKKNPEPHNENVYIHKVEE